LDTQDSTWTHPRQDVYEQLVRDERRRFKDKKDKKDKNKKKGSDRSYSDQGDEVIELEDFNEELNEAAKVKSASRNDPVEPGFGMKESDFDYEDGGGKENDESDNGSLKWKELAGIPRSSLDHERQKKSEKKSDKQWKENGLKKEENKVSSKNIGTPSQIKFLSL